MGCSTALAMLAAPRPAVAVQAPAAVPESTRDGGIPVESELVRARCGGCHKSDGLKRMSRISDRRASPENWERTVKRMVSLNQVSLTPADARAIVKYLSDHNGLAPEEARPAAFEAERRMTEWTYTADKDTAAVCTGCHSFGRVMSERRTGEEWGLLVAMHRGYYPLIDNQPIANGTGFRRSSALPSEPAAPNAPPPDTRQPMEKAIAHLSKAFPLLTPEWTAWSAAAVPPRLAGRWALSGNLQGKGPVFGEVVITADASAPDEFTTQTRFTIARTGQSVVRTGKGLVYTGFQWRGRGFEAGNTTDAWREVMFVERDQQEMSGRWMTGAYDETGLDVKLVRLAGGPTVLGASPPSLKTSTTGRTVQVFGANLPTGIRPEDVSLGQGVKVTRIVSANAGLVALEVDVAADARPGPRDIAVAGVVRPSGLIVYSTVDGIRVTPRAGLARVGGIVFPKQLQQFEAVAVSNGPDGKPDTDDDWSLGLVDVKWTVEEYTATFGDTDIQYVGRIDPNGMFTPNFDGPNPERAGNRNNVGDVWVVAEYTPDPGSSRVLRGRAQLVVTVPVYMQWPSEVGR